MKKYKPTKANNIRRKKALTRLAMVAMVAYVAPALMQLNQASASGGRIPVASDELTQKECGACHPPYSPSFMVSYVWQDIMNNLDNHFGEDASLDEKSRQHIKEYMVANAGRPANMNLRITKTRWFTRVHGNGLSAVVKKKIGSLSNCTGCHR